MKWRHRSKSTQCYISLREAQRQIYSELLKRLSKPALLEAGRRLGILRRGTLMFESEQDLDVVADFCMFDVLRSGRNAVDRYRLVADIEPGSDRALVLEAMATRPPMSLFAVMERVPGVGVKVRDILTDEDMLVFDLGLGDTGQRGLCLAARLLRFPTAEVNMTTGAGLATDLDLAARLARDIMVEVGARPRETLRGMGADERARITARILRELLAKPAG